jgi:hypothetical protein
VLLTANDGPLWKDELVVPVMELLKVVSTIADFFIRESDVVQRFFALQLGTVDVAYLDGLVQFFAGSSKSCRSCSSLLALLSFVYQCTMAVTHRSENPDYSKRDINNPGWQTECLRYQLKSMISNHALRLPIVETIVASRRSLATYQCQVTCSASCRRSRQTLCLPPHFRSLHHFIANSAARLA